MEREQLSFRIDTDKRNKFMGKVKSAGLNVTDILVSLVDRYLVEEGEAPSPDSIDTSRLDAPSLKALQVLLGTADGKRLMRQLADIVSAAPGEGRTKTIRAVRENLNVFEAYVKLSNKEQRNK